MNKTVLIDDRAMRQKKHLDEKQNEFNKFLNLKNICGGEEFEHVSIKFQKSDFSFLDDFSTILIHRSAFPVNTRNAILDHVRKSEKKVVFFSGGISQCEISMIGKAELLMINVSQFYGENIFIFFKGGANNLRELAFGKNWQLSTLIDTCEKLALYIKSYQDRPLIKIENDINLNNWIKSEYFEKKISNPIIMKSDIESILVEMKTDIKKLLK
jgi:hypothetical protein